MRKLPAPTALLAAALAALLAAAPAYAQPDPSELAGAWECRLPGQSTLTPPILWIKVQAPAAGPDSYEVDGFAGTVRSEGRFAAGVGGWNRLEPAGGVSLWVKPVRDGRRPGLLARLGLDGRPYACSRLPYPRT
jgi:hypothetical protein